MGAIRHITRRRPDLDGPGFLPRAQDGEARERAAMLLEGILAVDKALEKHQDSFLMKNERWALHYAVGALRARPRPEEGNKPRLPLKEGG